MPANSSGTGLSKNAAAALSYVLGPITGVVFLILEKDSFVRFHAMQSIFLFGGLFALQWLIGVTVILIPLIPLISLLGFILWLVLILKAWQGVEYEVPVVGSFARRFLTKFK